MIFYFYIKNIFLFAKKLLQTFFVSQFWLVLQGSNANFVLQSVFATYFKKISYTIARFCFYMQGVFQTAETLCAAKIYRPCLVVVLHD